MTTVLQVVLDAIDQICNTLGIYGELQKEEFTIFYVIDSGKFCEHGSQSLMSSTRVSYKNIVHNLLCH